MPLLLDARLAKKEFKDIYIELNGAGQAKEFVEDIATDGLKAKREENQGADSFEQMLMALLAQLKKGS